jgi:uncharacterized RDD family membrane protein YckC
MWYYEENGQQRGPVDTDTFAGLVRNRTVTPSTRIWRSGMAAWQPYADTLAVDDAANGTCRYCGKTFRRADLLDFNGTLVCADCKPLFVQQLKENAEISAHLDFHYAGFWVRVGATLLDGLITSVVQYAVIIPVSLLSADGHSSAGGVLQAMGGVFALCFVYGFGFLYQTLPLVKWGATPGKLACGLRVVRSDGAPITFGRATGRFFANALSGMMLGVGYLLVAFDGREHKALHDILCDTRVIYKR